MSSNYFNDENTPDWKKLYHFENLELEDEEFNKLVDSVSKQLSEFTLQDEFVIIHVAGILIFFRDFNLIELEKKQIVERAKQQLRSMKEQRTCEIEPNEIYPSDHSYGYQYASLKTVELQELISFAENFYQDATGEAIAEQAQELLKKMQVSMTEFEKLITLGNTQDHKYYNMPILQHIQPEEFVKSCMAFPNKNKLSLSNALKVRYRHSALDKNLIVELDWLKTITGLFNEEVVQRTSQLFSIDC